MFHGEVDEDNKSFAELSWREGAVLAPLLALIVFLGVYPKPVLDRMEPAVDRLITHVDENSDFVSPTVDRPEPVETEEAESDDAEDADDDRSTDEADDADADSDADEHAEAGK